MPARWLETYERGLADPLAQTEQRHQLALMEGLQEDALRRLETGESGEAWGNVVGITGRLHTLCQEIRAASAAGDGRRAGELARDLVQVVMDDLVQATERGRNEESARRELVQLFKDRARLIRVQHLGKKTVPVEVLASLQARFVALALKYVTDTSAMARMVAELRESTLPGWAMAQRTIEGELSAAQGR